MPHVVFVPFLLRSHLRIILQIVYNLLVRHDSLFATIMITRFMSNMLDQELELIPKSTRAEASGRVRVKILEDGLSRDVMAVEEKLAFHKLCIEGFRDMIKESDGNWGVPSTILTDMFRTHLRQQVHTLCDELEIPKIPVLHLMPTMALALHRTVNTVENGGSCQDMLIRYTHYTDAGMTEEAAARKAFRCVENRLLNWPDLPPMFDYEFTPQSGATAYNRGSCIPQSNIYKVSRNTDGLVCNSIPEIDGASLKRLGEIMNVPTFGIGPQVSQGVWDDLADEGETSSQDKEVIEFLDKAAEQYGPNSVLFFSLGSLFWPTQRPSLITTILKTLLSIDPPLPFIFAKASPKSTLSQEIHEMVESSGRGIIRDWVPQVKVLRHPATGIFLTHCGWGSMTESILAGVPILGLPFSMDQPALCAHFTQVQRIGVQLHQLSSGLDGLITGSGVHINPTDECMRMELASAIGCMRGEEGNEYRERIQRVRKVFLQSMRPGGGSCTEFERLGEALLGG